MARSQPGAKLIGSSTPESSSNGSVDVKISGANESSSPSQSARAYDTGVIISPSRASSASIRHDAERMNAESERQRQQDQQQRLDDHDQDVAQRAAEQQREAADRRHPQAFDDPAAQLGDQAEADARGTEQPELNQQARHEHVVRAASGKSRVCEQSTPAAARTAPGTALAGSRR